MHSWMRKELKKMDEATRQFVGDVYELIFSASELGGEKSTKAFQEIANALTARNVGELSGVDAARVTLTDEHWRRMAKDARVMASSSREEW